MDPAGRPATSRRAYLRTAAGGVVAGGLAGCLDLGADGSGSTGDDGATGNGDGVGDHWDGWDADAPPGGRVAVPADVFCAVCNMTPADYPDWQVQFAHGDGLRAATCGPGCGVAYLADPSAFDAPTDEVVSMWVRDYGTGEVIDGREAYYALLVDRLDDEGPMTNPRPFADESDARSYAGDHPDLEEADVVRGTALELEHVERYRTVPGGD